MSPLDDDLTNFDANGAAPLRGENLVKWTPSIHHTVVRLGKSWSFEDCKTMRSKRTILRSIRNGAASVDCSRPS